MRMEADPAAAGPMVQGFGSAGFRIDGEYYRAALLTVTSAVAWTPPSSLNLTLDALRPLIDARPEFILLGTGARLARPPAALVAALETINIGVEPMDSRAAARAWGVLRSEGRQIAAALYPLDWQRRNAKLSIVRTHPPRRTPGPSPPRGTGPRRSSGKAEEPHGT